MKKWYCKFDEWAANLIKKKLLKIGGTFPLEQNLPKFSGKWGLMKSKSNGKQRRSKIIRIATVQFGTA